jgi:hypothetical protein
MRPAWKWRLKGGVAAATLVGLAVLLLPSRTVLTVRSQKTGEARFQAPMAEGEEFVIAYVHSVNRRPVYDTLRVERGGLIIVKSRFDAFGAGIPETATAEHPLRFGPDGWMEYTVGRQVPEVTLFVGRVAQHALHLKGRTIALTDLEAPGSALRFSVEKQSLLRAWRTKSSHE